VFLTLSTGCSPLCLAGLFHPAATSEISLQGFSPTAIALTCRQHLPSCRLSTLTCENESSLRLVSPRLQGLDPAAGPLPSTGVLRLPKARSPLEFSAPRVFLRTLAAPSCRLRSWSWPSIPRVTPTADLQRIDQSPVFVPVSSYSPRPAFSACLPHSPKRLLPARPPVCQAAH